MMMINTPYENTRTVDVDLMERKARAIARSLWALVSSVRLHVVCISSTLIWRQSEFDEDLIERANINMTMNYMTRNARTPLRVCCLRHANAYTRSHSQHSRPRAQTHSSILSRRFDRGCNNLIQ